MKTNDKQTHIISTKYDAVMSGLELMYAPETEHDDLFNIEVQLSSAIQNLQFKINTFKAKVDKTKIHEDNMATEAGYSNAGTAKAGMTQMEIYNKESSKLQRIAENFKHTLAILQTSKEAHTTFYKKVLGKEYVPYSKDAVNKEKLAKKYAEAKEWVKNYSHLLEPVLD